MSTALPARPQLFQERCHIAIVASRYNAEFVDALLDSARDELQHIAPNTTLAVYRVPGAFEIPVTVEKVLRAGEADAVIALGVIIRGETQHADLVGESVTSALQNASVTHCTPVIHEVLLVNDEVQAEARCMGEDLNRGAEAARTAVNMISLFRKMAAAKTA